ncbi:phosphoesterase [Planoprotostelium fungivorum]|uniref:Phosphoesterase n=1 Tax=Planoprotostelium fungivorum TaxID=1890364 RepID=A0A2P6NS04_9EUKA|nr:phosphoesterase [Planoprotostelium fungivorum]
MKPEANQSGRRLSIGGQHWPVTVRGIKHRLFLGKKNIKVLPTAEKDRHSSLDGLTVTLDPAILVETEDPNDRHLDNAHLIRLIVKKQTLVNLPGLSGYCTMNDDNQLEFEMSATDVEQRDEIVRILRDRISQSRDHSTDEAEPTEQTLTTMIGTTKEYMMTDNDWNLITLHSQDYLYGRGSTVMVKNRPNRRLFRIKTGYVQIRSDDGSKVYSRHGPGSLLGEMSLLGDGFTSALCVAETDLCLSEISLQFLRKLFHSEPALELRFWHTLSVRIALRLQSALNYDRQQIKIDPHKEMEESEGCAGFLFKVNAMDSYQSDEFLVLRDIRARYHQLPGRLRIHKDRMVFQSNILGFYILKTVHLMDVESVSTRGSHKRNFHIEVEKERDDLRGERVREKKLKREGMMENILSRREKQAPLEPRKPITDIPRNPCDSMIDEEFFSNCNRQDMKVLFSDGQVIMWDGKPGDHIYHILTGHVVLKRLGQIIAQLGPGDIFGDVPFMGIHPIYGEMVVVRELEVVVVESERLKERISKDYSLGIQGYLRRMASRSMPPGDLSSVLCALKTISNPAPSFTKSPESQTPEMVARGIRFLEESAQKRKYFGPRAQKLRFVVVSDTHNQHESIKMPEADVFIHAGDFCGHGNLKEVEKFASWLSSLPYPHKIVIADWPFEREAEAAEALLKPHCTYLRDSSTVIDGIKFYGSPWQPRFFDWAFNLDRGEAIREKWNLIDRDTDILITHGPPKNFGGIVKNGSDAGCEDLLEVIQQMRPLLHISGHIHESYGVTHDEETTYINASTCTYRYQPTNPPVVFQL